MASNLNLTNAIVTAQAQLIADALGSGYLRIYQGAQPATADTAIGVQVLLAELRFAATAEASVVDGLITFAALTPEDSILVSDTAAFFRALESDGATVVMDGSAGTAACDLNLNSVELSAGAELSITDMEYTVVKA